MSSTDEHEHKSSLLSDSDTEFDEVDLEQHRRASSRSSRHWLSWLIVLSSLLLVFFGTRAYYTAPSWRDRLMMADMYSPLYKEFQAVHIDKVKIGDTLWNDNRSIYRQDPSEAVDAAWENLSHPEYMLVTEQELVKMGRRVDVTVRWPDDPDKFLMSLNGPHIMHCLDVLRRNAYHNFNHYYQEPQLNPIHWTHWGHCLEIIRQELMCRPSMHLHSMVWQEGQSKPFFDFQYDQMCVRRDDLEAMKDRVRIKDEDIKYVMEHPQKPKDVVETPTPPEGWEVFHTNSAWIKKMRAAGWNLVEDH